MQYSDTYVDQTSKFYCYSGNSLLTAEDFWVFCDLYLQFIALINLWNKCIDLRLFSNICACCF